MHPIRLAEDLWLKARSLTTSVRHLFQYQFSERKNRLRLCACCRLSERLLSESAVRDAIAVAERYADGMIDISELVRYRGQLERQTFHTLEARGRFVVASILASPEELQHVYVHKLLNGERDRNRLDRIANHISRDIFGNPFRPVNFDPRWRTSDTIGLARAIYDERAFDRLPILADALMDAGCEDEQIIAHCRSEGPHVLGCWAVDLVLGNS